MRVRRKRRLIRALRKSSELTHVQDNTSAIRPDDVLLVCTMRNEKIRLPYFLEYYRELGINHFLFVGEAQQMLDNAFTVGKRDQHCRENSSSEYQ